MFTYRAFVNWITDNREVVGDLVRMYLGVGLFIRGILFISESQGVEVLIDPSTFSFASAALVHYVSFTHLLGGLMLAVGLLTRLAALLQIPILVGAVFLVHLQEGLLSPNQSLEFSALVLFLLVMVFIFGPGPWSADRYVFEQESAESDRDLDRWWQDENFRSREAVSVEGNGEPSGLKDGGEKRVPGGGAVTKELVSVDTEEITCSCGNDLRHPRVTAEPRYGWSAGFFFMLGISAPVKEVVFYCEKCGTVMKHTRDPEIRRQYQWHTS